MFTGSFFELAAAIATILAGGFAFVKFVLELRQHKWKALLLLALAVAAFVGAAMIVLPGRGDEAVVAASKNEQLTAEAWNALNGKDYKRAIEITDDVLDNFMLQAEREQHGLETSGTPKPPVGKPRSEEEKHRTLERGLLNDVGTCYFIKGQAYEKLKNIDEAKKAYAGAAQLTYARTWDNGGWFWSPAQSAKDRLVLLSRN